MLNELLKDLVQQFKTEVKSLWECLVDPNFISNFIDNSVAFLKNIFNNYLNDYFTTRYDWFVSKLWDGFNYLTLNKKPWAQVLIKFIQIIFFINKRTDFSRVFKIVVIQPWIEPFRFINQKRLEFLLFLWTLIVNITFFFIKAMNIYDMKWETEEILWWIVFYNLLLYQLLAFAVMTLDYLGI